MAKSLFKALVTLGWAHDVELLLRAHQEGLAIVEMPVTWNAIEEVKSMCCAIVGKCFGK
ncbi:MAG: hypothetical protein IPL09_14930 [Bacteroidetes bacterium]|nr:hypothetical protein [Bacteroidota bacterium]